LVKPDLGIGADFLPAIEVFGEGIFFSLNEMAVSKWEQSDVARLRNQKLSSRWKESTRSKYVRKPTARYVLLHTLAHLLIRQLVYETGYSSASLRERIYSSGSDSGGAMAGILIYTAAGDSEGTLGGLVRSGEPRRLLSSMATALVSASWCSLDPVCGESGGQGPDSLSLAACHACCLVAETSCECSNVLLDRQLLVDQEHGFFNGVIETALRTSK
jgi:hypothetical protein